VGMFTVEVDQHLVVSGLADGGPAAEAGIQPGDLVLEVENEGVAALVELLRAMWRLGPAGVTVPLTVARDGKVRHYKIESADRNDFLKKPDVH